MKRNIPHSLWAAALLLASVSCSQDKLAVTPDVGGTDTLTITVTDGGYRSTPGSNGASAEQPQTRATENGYRTEFTVGDVCGLYVVRAGKVVLSNVKLIADPSTDGSLKWLPGIGITLAGGMADENYFLYYPYQADMSGKVDVAATDAEGFFAPLVSGWQPKADQSTYAAYYASDLMTARGTATRNGGSLNLSFSMTHRMALAVIEMPTLTYIFNNADVAIPNYAAAMSADFTDSDVRPYGISPGTYRCIVNPAAGAAASIIGEYDGGSKGFYFSVDGIAAGSCKTYRIDGAMTKSYDLQAGDFLCKSSSGSWYIVPKAEKPGSECIGIVFHVGHHASDQSNYSSTGIGQQKCHGYAVALKDATSKCMWGEEGTNLNNYSSLISFENLDIEWSGYNYTQAIISHAGGKDKLNATQETGYPATYYAVVKYQNETPAPTGSSGWFLPSIGQMWKIYQQRGLLTSVVGSTGLISPYYLSSTEYGLYAKDLALRVAVQNGNVIFAEKNKELSGNAVRPVLAF